MPSEMMAFSEEKCHHQRVAFIIPRWTKLDCIHLILLVFWRNSVLYRTSSDLELAEGEGFEPPLPVRVKRFSRPPVSTTHTSLRVSGKCFSCFIVRRLRLSPHSSWLHISCMFTSDGVDCLIARPGCPHESMTRHINVVPALTLLLSHCNR